MKSLFRQTQQYGSFCLRLGAVGFGAGSLVFTGLQIGAEIASGPFRAITPGARLLLVTAQMHFIFLNSKSLSLAKHTALAKLGLMHMIAANLCEWLQVGSYVQPTYEYLRRYFSSGQEKTTCVFEQLDIFHPSVFARKVNRERNTVLSTIPIIRVNFPTIAIDYPRRIRKQSRTITRLYKKENQHQQRKRYRFEHQPAFR